MRIVYILEHYYPHVGGVEVAFQHVAEGFAAQGHEATVITARYPGMSRRETVNSVSIIRVWTPAFARRYWFTVSALGAALRSTRRAHIVHTTTYSAAFPAWAAARIWRRPCVITVHEVIGDLWSKLDMSIVSRWLHRLLERLVLALPFTHYICTSYATQNRLSSHGIPTKKTTVVYHGVDDERFHASVQPDADVRAMVGASSEDYLFLYFGRAGLTKGVSVLINAFHRVAAREPNAFLVLIIPPTVAGRARLRTVLHASPANERIALVDAVERDRVPQTIASADCVVIPSLSEGFGLSAAEACALGKPLVVSRAGALPEVVSGKVVWVKPGSIDDLARGMLRAMDGAFEIISPKKFSWDESIAGVRAVYNTLVTTEAPRP